MTFLSQFIIRNGLRRCNGPRRKIVNLHHFRSGRARLEARTAGSADSPAMAAQSRLQAKREAVMVTRRNRWPTATTWTAIRAPGMARPSSGVADGVDGAGGVGNCAAARIFAGLTPTSSIEIGTTRAGSSKKRPSRFGRNHARRYPPRQSASGPGGLGHRQVVRPVFEKGGSVVNRAFLSVSKVPRSDLNRQN